MNRDSSFDTAVWRAFITQISWVSEWVREIGCITSHATSWVELIACFTSHATIFQSYMWRHRCAGGLKKKYIRSGSQRHRHFAGFFNVPVLHRHGTTLFIRWFRHTAPVSLLLRHGGTCNDISVTYVTAHRCAGGLKKKLDLWSGSQRHLVGFFNVPV